MKILKLIFLCTALLTTSCSSNVNVDFPNFPPNNNCLLGTGSMVSEARTLSDFNSISSVIFADVLLTQGPKENIIIEAQRNIIDQIVTEVVNGELRISLDRCVNILQAVKIHVTIPEIESLTLIGVGDFMAQNEFNLTELEVTLTGVGDFRLQGTTTELDISLTGVGAVKAFGLNTNECDVRITGVGDAEVFVNNELNVTITGSGTVFYKGNPTITSSITGSGAVVDAN